MRCLKRNMTEFSYAPWTGSTETKVGNLYSGERTPTYGTAVTVKGNISAAAGTTDVMPFGGEQDYDKVIVMEALPDGLNEYAAVWIEAPTSDAPDYVVRRVAKSINSVSIAVRHVNQRK